MNNIEHMKSQIRENLGDTYCDLVFMEGALNDTSSKKLHTCMENMEEMRLHVPYEKISKQIFQLDSDKLDIIVGGIDEKFSSIISKDSRYQRKLCEDTKRHIQLALVQKAYIDEKIEMANSELSEIKEVKRNIYTDFVSILGIFTAITFATFGGLQLLGNVFGKIKEFNASSVGSAMMLGAVYLAGTYMILLALLTGISKLKGDMYSTSFSMRCLILIGCSVIFMFGFLYANPTYLCWHCII